MPDSTPLQKSYPLLASLLSALVMGIFLLGLFSFYLRDVQDELAAEFFDTLRAATMDINTALYPLLDRHYTACSPENLRDMEAALFKSTYPKQIMFYADDRGLCSTDSGLLKEPLKRPPADFISSETGAEIWVNHRIDLDLMGEPFAANIIKLGNYSAMIDTAILALQESSPFQWQFIFRDTSLPATRTKHISGSEGLYQVRARVQDVPIKTLLYYVACNPDLEYLCLVLAASPKDLVTEYREVLFLFALLSLAVGNITGLQLKSYQQRQRDIVSRINNGFRNGAFFWHYQPIVDMEKNRIIGCEVLSRFHDQFGHEDPDTYLPALRQAGMTAKFSRLMFSTVLAELSAMAELPDGFKLSINIFPADIISGAIEDILAMPEISQSRFAITLEVTEEEYLDEINSQASLEKIQKSGLAISIDDFGTGYSNLKQLKKLNATYLKIDRSYIADLEDEPIKSSLIPHIINMAEQLDLLVIAEGIETFEQEVILVGLGVRYGQGMFFGSPMSADDLVAHIENRQVGYSGNAVILDD